MGFEIPETELSTSRQWVAQFVFSKISGVQYVQLVVWPLRAGLPECIGHLGIRGSYCSENHCGEIR
jgi:hypothetical protein